MNQTYLDVEVKGILQLSSYYRTHYEAIGFTPNRTSGRVTKRDRKSFPEFTRTNIRSGSLSMKGVDLVFQGKLVFDIKYFPWKNNVGEPRAQYLESIPVELTCKLDGSEFVYFKR